MLRLRTALLLTTLCLLGYAPSHAQQEDLQYTKEVGGGIGLNYMIGDLNRSAFRHMHPSADFLMRFVLSPRMAIKAEAGYNYLKGRKDHVKEFYPEQIGVVNSEQMRNNMFGHMVDLTAMYELNFLPYGWMRNYKGHKRITPYMQVGLGVVYAHTSTMRNGTRHTGNAVNVCIPVGIGLKYKVAPRLNLGLDWTMRFTPSDKLDGLADPTGIKSHGFHGKDFYSKTMFTLTYDISPKCPTCNKAD